MKPVVGSVSHPIRVIAEGLEEHEDEEDEAYADIPPPLLLAGAPILIPVRFVGLGAIGFTNLTDPLRTNAARPVEE